MPVRVINGQRYDARPDRVDLRDRVYMPKLVSMPDRYPSEEFIGEHLGIYSRHFILDQEKEGACTGFGLAATINYLLWKGSLGVPVGGAMPDVPEQKPARVSPWMLYRLARLYDEWPGEDYEGSSCRGAMKGWHRHGACALELWSAKILGGGDTTTSVVAVAGKAANKAGAKPKAGSERPRGTAVPPAPQEVLADAALRTLGAYYRIDKDSINDMQAAIHEVGAIYASADVHGGWDDPKVGKGGEIAMVGPRGKSEAGGHAFCIVGYTADGFIVQNSWGPDWGTHGFAVVPYSDWTRHAMDAWVAVMGVPVRQSPDASTTTVSELNIHERRSGMAKWFWTPSASDHRNRYKNPKVEPVSDERARELSIVMGNDGRPINPFLFLETAEDAARRVFVDLPSAWLRGRESPRVALYAHGGLNSEDASMKRIRVMAPYFIENGVYPIFFTWKTGVLESIQGRLEDFVSRLIDRPVERAGARILEFLADAKDRAIEAGSERVLVKGLWSEMKQNAMASGEDRGGLQLAVKMMQELKARVPGVEFHAIGHSAGSILLGRMLPLLADAGLGFKRCRLYAAACSVDFAGTYYLPAIQSGTIAKLKCDVLSDQREKDDSVGPYGKSLLYLVSRALEDQHKTPILGMENAWKAAGRVRDAELAEMWQPALIPRLRKVMSEFVRLGIEPIVHDQKQISTGRTEIPIGHGTFDNDVRVIGETLREIRGGKKLDAEIETLAGF